MGLTWRQLNLDSARLQVVQQLIPTPGGLSFGSPKSRLSERTVSLDADTVTAMRRHQEVQQLERDLAGPGYDDGDLVFADEMGRPIHPQRVTDWFRKHRTAAGIKTGRLHTLRHTHITLALTEAVPLHIVAARVGDKPETILATYAHLLPHSDAAAADAIAALLVDKPLTNAVAETAGAAL